MFIPIIRSDFITLENYNYKKREDKIECDVLVLYGKQDCIKSEEIMAWKNHVGKMFKVYDFEDDHIFINNDVKKIINVINVILIK